jgi:hypothetical protein
MRYIHYAIWGMMCMTSFVGGIIITAQMDYIREQAKVEVYVDMPIQSLSFLEVEKRYEANTRAHTQ